MTDIIKHTAKPSSGIIAWFARNSVAANLLMLLVVVLGLMQFGELRKETFPSIEPNAITIAVTYDSGSAKQAEEGLALKIEEALDNVTGIKKITSQSTSMGTIVTIEKESTVNLDTLLNDVKKEVDGIARFPDGAESPIISKEDWQDHALQISIHGDTDRGTLQQIQEALKQDLLRQPAIDKIITFGELDPVIAIEVDEGKLQAYGISFTDIANIINNESLNAVAGELRGKNRTFAIKAASQAYRYQDFARIPLKTSSNGSQVLLGDVANIIDEYDDSISTMTRFNGQPAMSLELVMGKHSDVTQVVSQARARVNEWQINGQLPENVNISAWNDQSGYIKQRIDLMGSNALQGVILVALMLAIFLNIRVAFWVAAGLPFVFLGTFFFMGDRFLGMSINDLTTFGFIMALGIVVDDAVVVGESIYTTKEEQGDTVENTIKGTKRVAIPTLFGILTTVAAFLPITQIEGELGKIFAQFSFVVVVCLLLSLVESKLILPAHLAHMRTKSKKASNIFSRGWQTVQQHADNGLKFFSQRIYMPSLNVALQYRYAVILGFISILILSAGLITTGKIRTVFFPIISGDVITASVTTVDDAGYGLIERHINTLEATLNKTDEQVKKQYKLKKTVIKSLQTSISGDNEAYIEVEFDKESGVPITEMEATWRKLTPQLEGVNKLEFSSSWLSIDDLQLEILGDDVEVLDLAATSLRDQILQIQGVKDIKDNLSAGQAQVLLTLTAEGRARGLSSLELAQQVLQNFGGERVQRYQRRFDETEVKVRYPRSDSQSLAALQQSRVRLSDGTVVPLANVAEISLTYEKKSITRLDKKTLVTISASVDKTITSPDEIISKLQRKIIPVVQHAYPGITIRFGGEAEEQAETKSSMKQVFVAALLVIFILLAVPLSSYVQPLLIMMAIPFGIVGAIWGHWISGLAISILSINGIMALSGVVVNDSLLLVSRFNELKQQGMQVTEAISAACRGRLRAIFLTSITTFVGLLPILSETSEQAEYLKPAAASMAYGILFATFITLVLIPVLLKVVDDINNFIRSKENIVDNVRVDNEALRIAS